jgi:tryptophan synthase alpha chain
MGKIEKEFINLKKKGKKAFITYFTFGFPSFAATRQILLALRGAPVDFIELGIPFSDPLADGPIIQEASHAALKGGATIDKFFSLVRALRSRIKVPLIAMTYYNPVLRFGMSRFLRRVKEAGIGGIMIVDLPVEESGEYLDCARALDLDTIFFITPQTPQKRIRKIAKVSRGFIYYVSVTGITGPRKLCLQEIRDHLSVVREVTDRPVCVGFGIHTRSQVESLQGMSDGVIVGSAAVKFVKDNYRSKKFTRDLRLFLKELNV